MLKRGAIMGCLIPCRHISGLLRRGGTILSHRCEPEIKFLISGRAVADLTCVLSCAPNDAGS